ncbi:MULTISPECIES: CCC motif membrane protein [Chryseobacterium]|uniref:CCC motif membrane protein n=1 Tax=Chryseobacterium TaxID=59732 RepID=UPI001BE7ED80|nr:MULTISPECIES: CCC motif membrane protein [Chryseobacterium]MBT2622769.1 DUF4190 domain-containing protein [Chryseobacterium sp. ISL-6]
MNQKLPNATTVLVLGIVAILGSCCCNGIVGVICGLIGMNLYNKDNALYQQNPSLYSDFDNLKVGRILCIIGLIIGILSLIYMIFVLSTVGWSGYMDQINQLKNMGK